MSDTNMSDNVIQLGMKRKFTEAEARAALDALWMTSTLARMTIAAWINAKRPTKDDLIQLALQLKNVEKELMNMGDAPPSDGTCLNRLIEDAAQRLRDARRDKR
jgi:hypothetical protein